MSGGALAAKPLPDQLDASRSARRCSRSSKAGAGRAGAGRGQRARRAPPERPGPRAHPATNGGPGSQGRNRTNAESKATAGSARAALAHDDRQSCGRTGGHRRRRRRCSEVAPFKRHRSLLRKATTAKRWPPPTSQTSEEGAFVRRNPNEARSSWRSKRAKQPPAERGTAEGELEEAGEATSSGPTSGLFSASRQRPARSHSTAPPTRASSCRAKRDRPASSRASSYWS